MSSNMTSVEIANLQKNNINLKIPKVEGYLVKKSSFSSDLQWFYDCRKKTTYQCEKTGLNYQYYIHVPDNACYVFMECRFDFNDSQDEIKLKTGSIIVTVYVSAEDFMACSLAKFYRIYHHGNALCSWDRFGYFTTASKSYNRINIVNAISKLRPNKKIERVAPKGEKGVSDYLFN
jgi:hypothetical protein